MVSGKPGAVHLALLLHTGDTRKITDHRRDQVLSDIMLFWDQVGGKLTYTTDPITSERRGILIDFVNAIVKCLSDPSDGLNGEAIIEGIKAGKKMVKLVASVMEEMKTAKRPT